MNSENSENLPEIPNYPIECEIGIGGMALVYKGTHPTLNVPVAIKLLKPDMKDNKVANDRFRKEPKILASFRHSNIVTIYDSGFTAEEQRYLVMEYLPGGSLKEKMQQGQLSPKQAINIIKPIADALDLAHRQGIVHRDLKPDNVLFREDDTPVLTDFGIAKVLDSNTHATAAGTMLGTYRYMSPEQFQGLQLDGRSDLYSLGILLVEMLTGKRPYDGDSVEVLITKRLTDPVPELAQDLADFQPIISQLLTKDPEQRYTSAAELAEALEALALAKGFVEIEPDLAIVIPEPENQSKLVDSTQDIATIAVEGDTTRSTSGFRFHRRWALAAFALVMIALGMFISPYIQKMMLLKDAQALTEELDQQDKTYQKRIAAAQDSIGQLEQVIQDLRQEIASNKNQHDEALKSLDQQEKDLQLQKRQQEDAKKQAQSQHDQELAAQRSVIEEIQQSLTLLELQTDAIAATAEAESHKLQQREKTATQQQQQAQNVLAEKKSTLAQLREQIKTAQNQNQTALTQHQQQLTELVQQETHLKHELNQATSELQQNREKFDAKYAELTQTIETTDQRVQQSKNFIVAVQQKLSTLEQGQNNVAPVQHELGTVAIILDNLEQKLKPTLSLIQQEETRQQQISDLLAESQNAFKRRSYTKPVNNNAVKWAEEVLKLDPFNVQAKTIISNVINSYLRRKNLKQATLLAPHFSAKQRETFIQLGGVLENSNEILR